MNFVVKRKKWNEKNYVNELVVLDVRFRLFITITNPFLLFSIAAIMPFKTLPAYCASKYGLRGLTLSAYESLRQYNIKVVGEEADPQKL